MLRFLIKIVVLGIFFLAGAAPVVAEVLAIFPIEDLSRGRNGVNREISDYLAWEMNERGFDVIAEEEVVPFMARHRMRWLGFLDTRNIISAKEELGADYILFGTISLRQKELTPSYGLTLYLVRTDDTRTIWTGSSGLSSQDIVNVLGINEDLEKKGLLAKLTQKVLETWPVGMEFVAAQQPTLEIDNYELNPQHVQRGDKVDCYVRLRTKWAEADMPRIFFKAAGRVYRASQSKDGHGYEGEWLVAERDGRYPVTMVVNWPSGRKKVAYIGAYTVDSTPPRVVLDLKGVQLQGTVAFRDKIIIVPRLLRREPVARWQLRVEDELGEEQMSSLGYGNLPKRFVWNGLGRSGWPAEEGIYKISLQVWDRANNVFETSEPVAVARTPPTMVLEAKNRGRDMIVDLTHEGSVPVAFWRMELRNDDGSLIKVAEGEDLPPRLDMNRPTQNTIKVADDLQPGKTIKVADDLTGPSKTIKVAEEGLRPPSSKTIKV
ncbi:MAG: hypothetical protein P1P81_09525, partial [Desulfobulbales bacterium]|nr:hypothetical protein [Desulfobulbales bacterium]